MAVTPANSHAPLDAWDLRNPDCLRRRCRPVSRLLSDQRGCSYDGKKTCREGGLQKDGSRAEYRDIIDSMLEEVNRLTTLIDNLLTISRADSGHIPLHRTTVSVLGLAHEAAALFEILTEEKSQTLDVGGDATAEVDGAPIFLRQALVNIIHNAVTYSPIGETISVLRSGMAAAISS